MSLNVRGIIPACVLTLDADGRFDEPAYRRYLQWLLPQGPVALAINADTGEGPHLWPEEREQVLRVAVEEAGDVPVIAGLSAQFTEQAVEEAKRAEAPAPGACSCSRSRSTRACRSIPRSRSPITRRSRAAAACRWWRSSSNPPWAASSSARRRSGGSRRSTAWSRSRRRRFDARLYLLTRRMIEKLPRPIDLLTGDDNFIFESFVMGAEGALIGFGTLATDLQVEMVGLTTRGPLGRGTRDLGADPADRGGRLRDAGSRLPRTDEGRAPASSG